jgi:hypothetical protein
LAELKRHALSDNVGGIPTGVLKNVFVAAMAATFLVEGVAHLGGWLGLGDPITYLTTLVWTEVPLWFAQVLLWSRGETVFERYEVNLQEGIATLERLGFTVDLFLPVIEEARAGLAAMTVEEREQMSIVMRAMASVYLAQFRERIRSVDVDASKKALDARRLVR